MAADLPEPVFYGVVLLCLSVNRFLLAGLSASLPHTVAPADLLTANALTPTAGTLAFVVGLGARVGLVAGPSTVPVTSAVLLPPRPCCTASPARWPCASPGTCSAPTSAGRARPAGARGGALRRSPGWSTACGTCAAGATPRAGAGAHRRPALPRRHRDRGAGAGLPQRPAPGRQRRRLRRPGPDHPGRRRRLRGRGGGHPGGHRADRPTALDRRSCWSWRPCPAGPGGRALEPGSLLVAAFVLGLASQGIKICVDTLVQRASTTPSGAGSSRSTTCCSTSRSSRPRSERRGGPARRTAGPPAALVAVAAGCYLLLAAGFSRAAPGASRPGLSAPPGSSYRPVTTARARSLVAGASDLAGARCTAERSTWSVRGRTSSLASSSSKLGRRRGSRRLIRARLPPPTD